MAKLWAKKIIATEKTFADVPRLLKAKVKAELKAQGREDLIIEAND